MVFSSFEFVLAFLPLLLAGYFILGRLKNPLYQKLCLIAASLFFYAFGSLRHLPLLLASLLLNWLCALLIQRSAARSRKAVLILGIVLNLLILGYYKYLNFFIENINQLSASEYSLHSIALPLAISFFTFQQIAWLLALYRGSISRAEPLDYLMYICFFPKLVMGPLAEPEELIPQFSQPSRRSFDADNFSSGLFIFCMGLFKKAVVADSLALFVDNGFALASPGLAAAWLTSLSYTLQLYFDFSGYSDMALGAARMLNFELPFNFLSPYRSESVSQFWRRWHITLGRLLSSLVYRPLGGSRCGLGRCCVNLLLTFLVSGLWHGAAWTFVLWGLLHGLFCALERVFKAPLARLPHWLRVAGCFITVNFLWVLFRAESFVQAADIYRGMFAFRRPALGQLAELAFDGLINFPSIVDLAYVIGLVACCLFVVFRCKNSAQWLESFRPTGLRLLAAVLMFTLSLMCMSRESIFIYFNF